MPRRRWLIALGAIALLLLFLAWQVPAGWALKLARSEHSDLSWSAARGSIWRGTADNVYWQGLALGRLEWRMLGLEDLPGLATRWQIQGESPQYRLDGRLVTDGRQLRRVEELQAAIPAAWLDLSHAVPLVYLTGVLHLDLETVSMRNGLPVSGSGAIRWTEAGLGGLVSEPLGDIEFLVRPAHDTPDGGILFEFQSLTAADIRVSGEGGLLGDAYDIRLSLRVAGHRADLRELLGPQGETGRNGEIRLQWQGKLFP